MGKRALHLRNSHLPPLFCMGPKWPKQKLAAVAPGGETVRFKLNQWLEPRLVRHFAVKQVSNLFVAKRLSL